MFLLILISASVTAKIAIANHSAVFAIVHNKFSHVPVQKISFNTRITAVTCFFVTSLFSFVSWPLIRFSQLLKAFRIPKSWSRSSSHRKFQLKTLLRIPFSDCQAGFDRGQTKRTCLTSPPCIRHSQAHATTKHETCPFADTPIPFDSRCVTKLRVSIHNRQV